MVEIRPMQAAAEMRKLILEGADINKPDAQGLAPLLRVLGWTITADTPTQDQIDSHSILAALLAAGADLDARTPDGKTADDLARLWDDGRYALDMLACERYRRSDAALAARVGEIRPYWPKPDAPISDMIKADFRAACRDALQDQVFYHLYHWPDAANWVGPRGPSDSTIDSPLVHAIRAGARAEEIVKALLEAGADPNWRDVNDNTALHYALSNARNGTMGMIGPLVMAGADETALNITGQSAVDIAESHGAEMKALLDTAVNVRTLMQIEKGRQTVVKNQALNARLSADPRRKGLRL